MVVFPARPGRSEGIKKGSILESLLMPLAGFRRTVSGDSRSENAVKPAAYWTYPESVLVPEEDGKVILKYLKYLVYIHFGD